uniref:tRNA-specific adenosine deaminase 1 n=1 Tax=Lygus hesperus TaxID=30085 RepID=A0A146LV80_LYGHE
MSDLGSESYDRIVRKVHDLYESLGKSGKPKSDEEWTCLASVVMENDSSFRVVSLATGTKCIGANAMVMDGTVVNDSHAEVLARRNFLRYLYDQLEITVQCGPSIFTKNNQKFQLKPGVKFHFYTSQVPCGDASIIPMDNTVIDQVHFGQKRKISGDSLDAKKMKLDVHRTGAKPVETELRQDPKGDGIDYHVRGAVRIKPGRGDRTKSLSCSDKMAKWLYCGMEGALLSSLLQDRIALTSIIIGGAGPFDDGILKEALVHRSGLEESPVFYRSNETFQHSSDVTQASRPSSASINWADVTTKKLEVSVDGRRLGVTKKSKSKSYLLTSKYGLFEKYLQLASDLPENGLTYKAAKQRASEYQATKERFTRAMGSWSEDKSQYDNFTLLSRPVMLNNEK